MTDVGRTRGAASHQNQRVWCRGGRTTTIAVWQHTVDTYMETPNTNSACIANMKW